MANSQLLKSTIILPTFDNFFAFYPWIFLLLTVFLATNFYNLQIIFLLLLTLIYTNLLLLFWVSKLCAPIIDKTISKLFYNGLWKIAITFPNVFLLYMPLENCLPAFFTSFVYTLLSAALHPSFYQTLAFAL